MEQSHLIHPLPEPKGNRQIAWLLSRPSEKFGLKSELNQLHLSCLEPNEVTFGSGYAILCKMEAVI